MRSGVRNVVFIAFMAVFLCLSYIPDLTENLSKFSTEMFEEVITTTSLIEDASLELTDRDSNVVEKAFQIVKGSTAAAAAKSSSFGGLCGNNNKFGYNDTTIASEDCLQQTAEYISRAFPLAPRDGWCAPSLHKNKDDKNVNHEWQGLLLVKTSKAASSTTAGLAFHIHNKTQGRCAVQGYHYQHIGMSNPFNNRDPNRSFLYAPVRKPSSRDISHIQFFQFAEKNEAKMKDPTYAQYMKALYGDGPHKLKLNKGIGGYQYECIAQFKREENLVSKKSVLEPMKIIDRLFDVFRSYGFFLVVERMDESMVVFSFLLGLDIRDVVLPSSAKVRDGSKIYNWRLKKCFEQKIYTEPPADFLEHLESLEYKRITYADQLLYRAANHSLDKTIKDTIGVERFKRALAEFRDLKERVSDYCGAARLGVTKCHANDTVITPMVPCYVRDFGCGYQCVNEFMELEKSRKL